MFCMALQTIQAQVITWSVKPGSYSQIEPCWENMFLVHKGNNIGVITGDGRVVVEPTATRFTGFYGGLGLVLKTDGGQERILGILSTDGNYVKTEGIYFAIPYQEFFSEGLLTVTTPSGKAGYMNPNGAVVKEFNVSFVSPFSEGYAVVGENENYTLVDKLFNTMVIQLGTVSQIYGGTNVYNGEAIVWDGNGKFYTYDAYRGVCRKISKPRSLDYDYMYCFTSLTGRSGTVTYEQPSRGTKTLDVIAQGNRYGYARSGVTILPCQFEQAENFYGTYAIAKTVNGYGILALNTARRPFQAKSSSEIKYRKSAAKGLTHEFGIITPDGWNEDNVSVWLKDENGVTVSTSRQGGNYAFKADGAEGTKKYQVEIEADGLKQWAGEIAYNYKVLAEPVVVDTPGPIGVYKPLTVKVRVDKTQANKDNRCEARAIITNPNSDAITTTVTMKGSNLLEAKSLRMTIPAHSSREITSYFNVKKASSGQFVTVTTTAGGSDTVSGLQLIPF